MNTVRWTRLLLALLIIPVLVTGNTISKDDYLDYARTAAEAAWESYDEDIERWADTVDFEHVFGYRPPSNPVYLAYVNAHLYKMTQKEEYMERAKKCLLEYGEFREYYPDDFWTDKVGYEEGVPALPSFFTAPMYIRAFILLDNADVFSKQERDILAENIAVSCDHQVKTQEWGAMNRGIIRGEVFALAAMALPDHPHAPTWKMLADAIIDDCWGAWEIEDASHYAGIYLYSLVSTVETMNERDFYAHPVTRYTMQYYVHQIAPHGMIPDYGDANLYSNNWHRYVAVFEKAATMYQDSELKYAANRIAGERWNFNADKKSMWLAVIAMDCFRWADNDIPATPPPPHSEKVLDDVVGKKIVFRDGYGPKDTYMMVNYKDEGQAGFLSREFLRWTIAVEEEKMTHGHSDENDIPLLMTDGCLLLQDGGFRVFMPSGVYCDYRSDFFHNSVFTRTDKLFKGQKKGERRYAVKDERAVPGQNVLDFVRNSGAYRPVDTELIDFLRTDTFDYSRTRVKDDQRHTLYDRIVTWVKPLNVFVVFDVVKALADNYYTTVNFWHTQTVRDSGTNWFDTGYSNLRRTLFPTHKSLLIHFPQGTLDGRMIGSDPEMRYYREEVAIHQSQSRYHHHGDLATFTTVLTPHDTGADVQPLLDRVEMVQVDKAPLAVGVKLTQGNKTYYVCSKLDRRMDLRQADLRPMYKYEQGKVTYDDFETDAHQLMMVTEGDQVEYTAVYAAKLLYKNKPLFQQPPVERFGLQFDAGPDRTGIPKVRYWQDSTTLPE